MMWSQLQYSAKASRKWTVKTLIGFQVIDINKIYYIGKKIASADKKIADCLTGVDSL